MRGEIQRDKTCKKRKDNGKMGNRYIIGRYRGKGIKVKRAAKRCLEKMGRRMAMFVGEIRDGRRKYMYNGIKYY